MASLVLPVPGQPFPGHRRVLRGGKKVRKNRRPTELSIICQKTKLCVFNAQGSCDRGNDCHYAHSESELRAAPNLSRTKMCPAIKAGRDCTDRWECAFAHSMDEVTEPTRNPIGNPAQPMQRQGAPSITNVQTFPLLAACLMASTKETSDTSVRCESIENVGEKHYDDVDLWSQRSTDCEADVSCSRFDTAASDCSDSQRLSALQVELATPEGVEVHVSKTFLHFVFTDSFTNTTFQKSKSMPTLPVL